MPQHDRLDLARVLLAKAIDDETLVRKVSPDTDIADAIVGFHAQQAVEKLIKAVLVARGVALRLPPQFRPLAPQQLRPAPAPM